MLNYASTLVSIAQTYARIKTMINMTKTMKQYGSVPHSIIPVSNKLQCQHSDQCHNTAPGCEKHDLLQKKITPTKYKNNRMVQYVQSKIYELKNTVDTCIHLVLCISFSRS